MKRRQFIALMAVSMFALNSGGGYLVHAQEPVTIKEEASSVPAADITLPDSSEETHTIEEAGDTAEVKDSEEVKDTSTVAESAAPASPSETATMQAAPKADGVPIDKDHFPDEAFRNHVLTKYDTNDDNILSSLEVSVDKAITFVVNDEASNAKDFTGIQYFTEMTKFMAGTDDKVETLDFSENKKLEEISIVGASSLTSLIVSGCENLKVLECTETNLSDLDVSNVPSLETLRCNYNPITDLDISKNPNLTTLSCHDTQITSLDVSQNPKLSELTCSHNPGLTSLDVTHNSELTELECSDTALTSLDVSHNLKLTKLGCSDIKMPLDVSANTELVSLTCENMGLETLDISKNTKLERLTCEGNQLTSLDVTANDLLEYLYLGENQLFDVKGIADDQYIYMTKPLNPTRKTRQYHTLSVSGDSIDMSKVYPDFDPNKVCEDYKIKNAVLDGTTFKDIKPGTEIVYHYVVGPKGHSDNCLEIHIKVLGENSWTIAPSITDWTYGEAAPIPTGEAAFGDVVFTYSSSPDGEFTADVPTEAGTYYMKASVAESDSYGALETVVPFTIHAAENSWIEEPAIADWEEGSEPSTPTAKAAIGDPIFTYSSSRDGEFTANVPTAAGTYYMKATVEAKNYNPLEKIVEFQITKKADNGDGSGSDKPNTPGKDDGKPGTPSNGTNNSSVHKAARTGDMSSIVLLVSSLAASAGCGTLCLRRKKKDTDK